MSEGQPILQVRNLQYHIPIREGLLRRQSGAIRIVDGVSFDVYPGESVAIVGETGVGKTTLGRTIIQLFKPTGGEVVFQGERLTHLSSSKMRQVRQKLQMVFQDPYTSLSPRMTMGALVDEPLNIHNLGNAAVRRARVDSLLAQVGVNPYLARHYPHEFSGGTRQRVSLARALATDPIMIIVDEPAAALDSAVGRQMQELLSALRAERGLTYLFLAAGLAAVPADVGRVAVMYGGQIVEMGARDDVAQRPLHPYTQALAAAVPLADPEQEARRQRIDLGGKVADPANYPAACRFHPRCPHASDICRQQTPEFRSLGTPERPHHTACHHAERFL